MHIACVFSAAFGKKGPLKGWHYCKTEVTVDESNQAKNIVVRAVQEDVYTQEIQCVQRQQEVPKDSHIKKSRPPSRWTWT